jgi:hypothetical protein
VRARSHSEYKRRLKAAEKEKADAAKAAEKARWTAREQPPCASAAHATQRSPSRRQNRDVHSRERALYARAASPSLTLCTRTRRRPRLLPRRCRRRRRARRRRRSWTRRRVAHARAHRSAALAAAAAAAPALARARAPPRSTTPLAAHHARPLPGSARRCARRAAAAAHAAHLHAAASLPRTHTCPARARLRCTAAHTHATPPLSRAPSRSQRTRLSACLLLRCAEVL